MDCILPSAYLAPISYYVQMHRHKKTWTEVCDNYHKQTYRNRCTIATANGPLALSIPVVKSEERKVKMKDVRISDHGNWRHQHWNALQSSYMKSPFFAYYADEIAPFYSKRWEFLADFNEELQQKVCELIDISPNVRRTTHYEAEPHDADDFRERIHPRRPPVAKIDTYYQVFASRFGFIPDLSIVDLLFNMGPESVLCL